MKIAICDNNAVDRQYLQALLQEYPTELYECAENLLSDVESGIRYDLYLLDIYLDTMNGIELAKRMREQDGEAVICFISSSDAFYREAYDLYAIQYLLKPVKRETLLELIEKVESRLPKAEPALHFKWRGKIGSIACSRILFVSSQEHKLSIYCTDGTIQECIGKISGLAGQIDDEAFVRVHQSYLVNMNHVDCLNGGELLVGRYSIPISRRYAAEVKKKYQELLFAEPGRTTEKAVSDDKKAESTGDH